MEIGVNHFVTYNTYFVVVNGVKQQDSIAFDQLISGLKIHFPPKSSWLH
jgi:predicted small integral membrane protein